jgi:hypothetical protein
MFASSGWACCLTAYSYGCFWTWPKLFRKLSTRLINCEWGTIFSFVYETLGMFWGLGVSAFKKGTKMQTCIMFRNSRLKVFFITTFSSSECPRISFLCYLTRKLTASAFGGYSSASFFECDPKFWLENSSFDDTYEQIWFRGFSVYPPNRVLSISKSFSIVR